MNENKFDALESKFNNIVNVLPNTLKGINSDDIPMPDMSKMGNKDSLGKPVEKAARKLKITPLSYVDERRFYSYVDSAYKIYEQLLINYKKYPKGLAWFIANIAMCNWYYRALIGQSLNGREVEKLVDAAIRSPMYFLIVNCFLSMVKMVFTGASIYYATDSLPDNISSTMKSSIFGYYIISMMINVIKVSIRIMKKKDESIDAVRPILT